MWASESMDLEDVVNFYNGNIGLYHRIYYILSLIISMLSRAFFSCAARGYTGINWVSVLMFRFCLDMG